MKVNISEVESIDDYPPGTEFVLDNHEGSTRIPKVLERDQEEQNNKLN